MYYRINIITIKNIVKDSTIEVKQIEHRQVITTSINCDGFIQVS